MSTPRLQQRILIGLGVLSLVAASSVYAAAQETAADADDAAEVAVRDFIEHYFRTWSAQDIERYGQCFHPQSVIQLVDPSGALATMGLRRFLASQRAGHENSAAGMTETAESIDVRFEGRLARVVVFWKLVEGDDRTEYGYDHFTLIQSGGRWRIANLIFYATPPEEAPQP